MMHAVVRAARGIMIENRGVHQVLGWQGRGGCPPPVSSLEMVGAAQGEF